MRKATGARDKGQGEERREREREKGREGGREGESKLIRKDTRLK